jgi:hypothetical protein
MPDQFVTVYLKETGQPTPMHAVDAAEALRIGDYVSNPPEGNEPSEADLKLALTQAQGIGTQRHPELMTPEQRDEARRQAYAAAEAAKAVTVSVAAPTPAPQVGAPTARAARGAAPPPTDENPSSTKV